MATRVDGRTARRDRNSDAVLDAVHELFVERPVVPTVEDVASPLRGLAAGRSTATSRTVARCWEQRSPGASRWPSRSGSSRTSVRARSTTGSQRLVAHRLALYETSAPTIRAALSLAHEAPAIARQVERRRRQLGDQTRRHFATELAALPEPHAEAVVTCLELLCQFEAIDQLRVHRGLTPEDTQRDPGRPGSRPCCDQVLSPSPAACAPLPDDKVLSHDCQNFGPSRTRSPPFEARARRGPPKGPHVHLSCTASAAPSPGVAGWSSASGACSSPSCGGGSTMLGDHYDDSFSIPGTQSQQGQDLLGERFGQTGATGQILFTAPSGKITDKANADSRRPRSSRRSTRSAASRSATR